MHSAAAWVGIDGNTCENAILQTGVDFTIEDGEVSYQCTSTRAFLPQSSTHSPLVLFVAWYEWYPEPSYDFTDISFDAGDSVTLTVTASSTTSGTVVITNNSKNQSVNQTVSSSDALCGQDAEWIVEDFEEGNSLVPFVNFGTVTFTNAAAGTSSGSVGPSGATIMDIEQNGKVLTSASVSGSSVTVSYT